MMERQTLSDNGQFDEPLLIEKMIALRIACPEGGYPQSEARYASIEEWERVTGFDFGDLERVIVYRDRRMPGVVFGEVR